MLIISWLLTASYKSGGLLFVGNLPITWSQSLWCLISVALSTIGATSFLKLFLWGWSAVWYHLLYSFHFILLLSSCSLWNVESLFYESVLFRVSLHLWDVCWACLERWCSNLWPQPPCVIWLTSPKYPGPTRSHFLTWTSVGLSNLIHLLYLITFSPEAYIFSVSYHYLFKH